MSHCWKRSLDVLRRRPFIAIVNVQFDRVLVRVLAITRCRYAVVGNPHWREFIGGSAKLVGRFTPRFQLGGRLKLKGRLLLLDFLAEGVDIFPDLRLERAPTRFPVVPSL
jgi:hypothetical protein